MKVLFLEWKSFGKDDILSALRSLGHDIVCFSHPDYTERSSKSFTDALEREIDREHPDCVFSSNYYPLISRVCDPHGIPYLSWVYDCPQVLLFSTAVLLPCNHIFVFDRDTYESFHNSGINTFHYMPLAAPVNRYDSYESTSEIHRGFDADISFVGSLYNESHNFFERLQGMSDYVNGYLKGIMDAQLMVNGYNFIEECLTDDILKEMARSVPYKPAYDGAESLGYIYSRYFIDRKLTELERIHTLDALSQRFQVSLYTHQPTPGLPKVHNRGPIDYIDAMPYAFQCSKINLNITLRSIHTGIPLRAFDIMGCGGFLMTNYQADFLDYFIPDEDYVYYENIPDLTDKCHYYLTHEDERQAIARNGYNKVKANHTYEIRLKEIFDCVFHSES